MSGPASSIMIGEDAGTEVGAALQAGRRHGDADGAKGGLDAGEGVAFGEF